MTDNTTNATTGIHGVEVSLPAVGFGGSCAIDGMKIQHLMKVKVTRKMSTGPNEPLQTLVTITFRANVNMSPAGE